MALNEGKLCTNCEHSVTRAYGYSNYTVDGDEVDCKFSLNPNLPKDSFYEEEPALKFAEQCDSFLEGEGEYHDVECPYDCVNPECVAPS